MNWRVFQELRISLQLLLINHEFWKKGYPFLIVALVLSFWSEIFSRSARYNSILLLTSLVSSTIQFSKNSTRQYIIYLLLLILSFLLDLKLYLSLSNSTTIQNVFFYGINLSKGLAIRNILYYSSTAIRIRKYLHRRLRIFFIPCSRPRKLRREIIARILAIIYLQSISTILYIILSITAMSAIWFSQLMTRPPHGYLPLAAFFPIKILTSSIVLYGLYTDTDVILAMSYFGLITCWSTKFVREYISKKRIEYGGFPIPYGLNPYRVYVISFLKVLDFLWGVGGWCTIGTTFGKHFFSMNTNLIGVIVATAFTLILSDIWIPILFGVVLESLRYRASLMKRRKNYEDSDDSELEELGLVEKDISKEFVSVLSSIRAKKPLRRQEVEEDDEDKREKEEGAEENFQPTPRSILKKPKPFHTSTPTHQRIGLNDIHSSQFKTTRRSSK